jgi:tetratricopeptide (TPR) repeat protein
MGRLILCHSTKAQNPYYVKNMNINLYTIEELCYYLLHNIYLIDENVINDNLIRWIEKELSMKELAEQLNQGRGSMRTQILIILNYTGYVSKLDVDETDKLLSRLGEQTDTERSLSRADNLLKNKKYVDAILEYVAFSEVLDGTQREKVWNNMGVAYAGLFHYVNAANCFWKAYEIKKSSDVYKQYLYAVSMIPKYSATDNTYELSSKDREMIKDDVELLYRPESNLKLQHFNTILNHKKESQIALYYKGLEEMLSDLKKEYQSQAISMK